MTAIHEDPIKKTGNNSAKRNIFFQPKLSINTPGDSYEQEADAMADKVMRMKDPFASPTKSDTFFNPTLTIQRKTHSTGTDELEDEHLHRKEIPNIQRKCTACENEDNPVHRKESSTDTIEAGNDLSNYISSLGSSGQELPEASRQFFEPRFGEDFSHVKIHTGSVAAKSAQSINALAYTTGNNIVFNQGQYSPNSEPGQRLLAHELTHTVQQKGSVGLGMRRHIQRSVDTWGGTWDANPYDEKRDVGSDGTVFPAAMGVRGVDITVKFSPNARVDAELIGLTQSVQSVVNGAVSYTNPTNQAMSITSADAKAINTGRGETDEGTAIDRAPTFNNPIYAVRSMPSASLDDTNVSAGWGQLGWRYTGANGAVPPKDATLIDKPRRANAQKDSRHIFETTALATKGAQSGTYYGSVRWGWRSDSAGAFSKIPLSVVSQGVPSSTFMKSAQLWNASKDSTGANTVSLPIVDVKITTAAITPQYPAGFVGPPNQIPAGTRVQIIRNAVAPSTNGQIKVVDGANTGQILDVAPADMANLRSER